MSSVGEHEAQLNLRISSMDNLQLYTGLFLE